MKYKVMIDYTNFIPIDGTELEKALKAFTTGNPVVFENGATEKIQSILPDYHAIMGFNYGYKLEPEDYSLIQSSKECIEAKKLLAETKEYISTGIRRKELTA